MSFSHRYHLAGLAGRAWRFLALAVGLLAGQVFATEPAALASDWQLTLTPQHCVTLEQGRLCYADIRVSWQLLSAAVPHQAAQPAQLCLYLAQQRLRCWPYQTQGQWQFEFAAAQSQQLDLRVAGQLVASRTIQVSWVQQKSRHKRQWRLF